MPVFVEPEVGELSAFLTSTGKMTAAESETIFQEASSCIEGEEGSPVPSQAGHTECTVHCLERLEDAGPRVVGLLKWPCYFLVKNEKS